MNEKTNSVLNKTSTGQTIEQNDLKPQNPVEKNEINSTLLGVIKGKAEDAYVHTHNGVVGGINSTWQKAEMIKPAGWSYLNYFLMLGVTNGLGAFVAGSNYSAELIKREIEPNAKIDLDAINNPVLLRTINQLVNAINATITASGNSDSSMIDYGNARSGKHNRDYGNSTRQKYMIKLQNAEDQYSLDSAKLWQKRTKLQKAHQGLAKLIKTLPKKDLDRLDIDLIQAIHNATRSGNYDLLAKLQKRITSDRPLQKIAEEKITIEPRLKKIKPPEFVLKPTKKSKIFSGVITAAVVLVAYNPWLKTPVRQYLDKQARVSPLADFIVKGTDLAYHTIGKGAKIAGDNIVSGIANIVSNNPKASQSTKTDLDDKKNNLDNSLKSKNDSLDYSSPIMGLTVDNSNREKSKSAKVDFEIIGKDAYYEYNKNNHYYATTSTTVTSVTNQYKIINRIHESKIETDYAENSNTKIGIISLNFLKYALNEEDNNPESNITTNHRISLDVRERRIMINVPTGTELAKIKIDLLFHPTMAKMLDLKSIDTSQLGFVSLAIKPEFRKEVKFLIQNNYHKPSIKYPEFTMPIKESDLVSSYQNDTDKMNNVKTYNFKEFTFDEDLYKIDYEKLENEGINFVGGGNPGSLYPEEQIKLQKYLSKNGSIPLFKLKLTSINQYNPTSLVISKSVINGKDIQKTYNIKVNKIHADTTIEETLKKIDTLNISKGLTAKSFGIPLEIKKGSKLRVPKFAGAKVSAYSSNSSIYIDNYNGYITINEYGNNNSSNVFVVYTPQQENYYDQKLSNLYKSGTDNYLPSPNSGLTNISELEKKDNIMSAAKLLESAAPQLKIKINEWKNKIAQSKNEQEMKDIILEIQDYINKNNYYGYSEELNKKITASDNDLGKIFGIISNNMYDYNKENTMCQTTNLLLRVVLNTLGIEALQQGGYIDDNENGKLEHGELHSFVEVITRDEYGSASSTIYDSSKKRKESTPKFEFKFPEFDKSSVEIVLALIIASIIAPKVINELNKRIKMEQLLKKITAFNLSELITLAFQKISERPSVLEKKLSKLDPSLQYLIRAVLTHPKYSEKNDVSSNPINSYKVNSENLKSILFTPESNFQQLEAGIDGITDLVQLQYLEKIILSNIPKNQQSRVKSVFKELRKRYFGKTENN